MGAEDRTVYGEEFAPDKQEYGELLGHSILFYIKDIGKPVEYTAPNFALKDVETLIPKLQNPNYFNVNQLGCKYWWLEYGGRLDTILDTEEIKYELWKVVYGVWDYIKNSGKFPQAKTLTLESRRFNGLYTLTQQDVINQSTHYDAVAYGGWAIDLHPADGVYAGGNGCHQWHSKGVYQIPYRCYVTPDLDNLFVGGRIISSSHVANGTTRVMCTSALGGEVIGRAASICLSKGYKPIDLVDRDRIGLLQSLLVKNGNFIPGIAVAVEDNLAEALVRKILRTHNLEQSCKVSQFGSKENSYLVGAGLLLRGETLDNTLIVLDGDVDVAEAEKRTKINRVITGTDNDSQQRRDKLLSKIKQFCLPVNRKPEEFITDELKTLDDAVHSLIPHIKATGPVQDHHDLLNTPITNSGMPEQTAFAEIVTLMEHRPCWANYVAEIDDWVVDKKQN